MYKQTMTWSLQKLLLKFLKTYIIQNINKTYISALSALSAAILPHIPGMFVYSKSKIWNLTLFLMKNTRMQLQAQGCQNVFQWHAQIYHTNMGSSWWKKDPSEKDITTNAGRTYSSYAYVGRPVFFGRVFFSIIVVNAAQFPPIKKNEKCPRPGKLSLWYFLIFY